MSPRLGLRWEVVLRLPPNSCACPPTRCQVQNAQLGSTGLAPAPLAVDSALSVFQALLDALHVETRHKKNRSKTAGPPGEQQSEVEGAELATVDVPECGGAFPLMLQSPVGTPIRGNAAGATREAAAIGVAVSMAVGVACSRVAWQIIDAERCVCSRVGSTRETHSSNMQSAATLVALQTEQRGDSVARG